MTLDPVVQAAGNEAGIHMDKIASLFAPGMKLCLIVWRSGNPDSEFVMTSDDFDLSEAAKVLLRRKNSPDTIRGKTE